MKKLILCLLVFTLLSQYSVAQVNEVDSLNLAYKKDRQDTTLINFFVTKGMLVFLNNNLDSSIYYFKKAQSLSRNIHYQKGELRAQLGISAYIRRKGDLPSSLKIVYELLPKAIAINDKQTVLNCYNSLGFAYNLLKDYKKALYYQFMMKSIAEKDNIIYYKSFAYNNIARQYLDMGMADSAAYYNEKGYKMRKLGFNTGYNLRNFGAVQVLRKNYAKGIEYFKNSLKNAPNPVDHYLLSEDYRRIAEAYTKLLKSDSSIYYAKKAYLEAALIKNPELLISSSKLLTEQYSLANDFKNAFNYQQIMLNAQDSLFSQQKTLQIQTLTLDQEQQKREAEAARQAYQNKVQKFTMLGIIVVFVLIAGILLYANNQRKKANKVLEQRNQQIENQHKALEKSHSELKTTQTQLIQSEKMASLGELTAGIAHEIQNPLNFVNNFSEVSKELLEELKDELDKGDVEEAKIISDDVIQNLEKINHHGKRADAIVKGMLEHSRAGSGAKEPTDINKLADEYLRLSYHGLRAKDKSFNATITTNLDENLPLINLIPQDIGRVFLNLFNNAFYAVNQKAKTPDKGYQPEVTITTYTEGGKVIIKVKDNGTGIPDAIKDKIMQPFFTTKPTGEGTGLGLSLTYDMVVKGMGEV